MNAQSDLPQRHQEGAIVSFEALQLVSRRGLEALNDFNELNVARSRIQNEAKKEAARHAALRQGEIIARELGGFTLQIVDKADERRGRIKLPARQEQAAKVGASIAKMRLPLRVLELEGMPDQKVIDKYREELEAKRIAVWPHKHAPLAGLVEGQDEMLFSYRQFNAQHPLRLMAENVYASDSGHLVIDGTAEAGANIGTNIKIAFVAELNEPNIEVIGDRVQDDLRETPVYVS